jgi:type VI protein secretion system component VasF
MNNNRLRMKLLRAAVVESLDNCDPTRSHELSPSRRIATRAQSNRAVRRLLTWSVLALAAIALLAALFSRPSAPVDPLPNIGADGLLITQEP